MTNRENPIHRIKSYLGSGSGSKSKWYGSETLHHDSTRSKWNGSWGLFNRKLTMLTWKKYLYVIIQYPPPLGTYNKPGPVEMGGGWHTLLFSGLSEANWKVGTESSGRIFTPRCLLRTGGA